MDSELRPPLMASRRALSSVDGESPPWTASSGCPALLVIITMDGDIRSLRLPQSVQPACAVAAALKIGLNTMAV
ncbi:hypothetical protein ACP70R_048108 [Stipagrostis hirtigluma subsp. patula]